MDNDNILKAVGNTAGVDFISLRNKYSGMSGIKPTKVRGQEIDEIKAKANAEAHERLDKFQICKKCNGVGYIKEIYNHQVREKNCDECDGESLVMKQILANEVKDEPTLRTN